MAFTPVANTSFCEIRWTQGTNRAENTVWYRWAGSPPSSADLLNLATAVGAGVAEKIRLAVHNSVTFREVHCRNMDVVNGNQATALFTPGTVGARGFSPVAANEAGSIVRRTGQSGRSSHGAIRVSAFSEADVDGNSLGNNLMTLLLNIAAELVVSYVGGTFKAALGSKTLGISRDLNSATVLDSNVDSQKTRLNNHGD